MACDCGFLGTGVAERGDAAALLLGFMTTQ